MPPATSAPVRTAIVYDFDGTLIAGSIQEHSLIPEYLGLDTSKFWKEVKDRSRADDADEILIYMELLLEKAKEKKLPFTEEILKKHGAKPLFFRGVVEWFKRISAHARERNLLLEHFVISSGNEEMIRGCDVAGEFTKIFASRYRYEGGNAVWPAVAINYTTKTQYLFRINKGIDNSWDNERVNRWQPMDERAIPFSRMIYLGDGDTDIPSMKMVRHQGGYSVAVFDPEKWSQPRMQKRVYSLIAENRADFVVPADYTDGSQLDITLKGILGRIARDDAGYREPVGHE
jgi:hypothetical protein